ncbi:hypothetical protein QTJ16_003047 [Diplocarpon rosae]|uniref:Uncharacterized protein n=1 Tax=Diplocarpon rosae TaxID=946125 RepID=A0AAD9T0E5_9HELO|nr:hypothetical protein QTJ16_003047 [Diplocarpon rosae]
MSPISISPRTITHSLSWIASCRVADIFTRTGTLHSIRSEAVVSVPTNASPAESQTPQEYIIVLILFGVTGCSFIALLACFVYERYQRANYQRQLDIEEGLQEVKEARDFRLSVSSLRERPYTPYAGDLATPSVRTLFFQAPPANLQVPITPIASNTPMTPSATAPRDAHALFNPNLMCSRTHPGKTSLEIPSRPRRASISYPNIADDEEIPPLASHTSFASLISYYRGGSIPMARNTTMQTRRPSSPPMLLIPRTPSLPRHSGDHRRVMSFWSVSEESIGPYSPGPESAMSESPPSKLTARPAPSPFSFSQVSYSDSSTTPFATAGRMETPRRAIFPIDMRGALSTLSYPPPSHRRSSGALATPEPSLLPPPLSPRYHEDYPSPRMNDAPFLSPSKLRDSQELPSASFERWRAGSAGTAFASDSVLAPGRAPSAHQASGDLRMYRRRQRRFSVVSMTSSRRGSSEEIFIEAAFGGDGRMLS